MWKVFSSTLQAVGQQADKARSEPKAASLKPFRSRKKSVGAHPQDPPNPLCTLSTSC